MRPIRMPEIPKTHPSSKSAWSAASTSASTAAREEGEAAVRPANSCVAFSMQMDDDEKCKKVAEATILGIKTPKYIQFNNGL